ncbi:mitochondrial transcription termination factorfamily protein [Striga asiatica]|uniref:Mitochondrial transcription termination factorfamily protein n=1 Tax=Striga asiatica TaxID=4170 RepID=A0A5A7QE27_STRAF|nr:mitochondrial transcription termination factorfamily protein [Striga asiatica]
MIARLNNPFLYPAVCEKNPIFFFHYPPPPPEIQFAFGPLSTARRLHTAAQTPIAVCADGIPRVVKADAQSALCDYLHSTRGLSFLDAEHISKNSPRFVAKLIAKVEKEQDISRALTRFFRYNPINEFEPFFESLGLRPKESESLLPRGLFFLADDPALLDNFQTLSSYGVPRSKIGRMYKEANELFGYEYGLLESKLRAYENSGMHRSTVIKLVTCCPLLLVGNVNGAFVKVFDKLNELGFDENWIGRYLSVKKNTYNWNRILDALCFLHEVGYSNDEIEALLKTDTSLLFQTSGKEVYSVVCTLLKLGLTMRDIYNVVSKNPQILSSKFAKNFWKALNFLIEIGMDRENTGQILSSHMNFFNSRLTLNGPKTVGRKFGNCRYSLCEAIKKDPSSFFKLAFKSNNLNADYLDARNPNNIVQKTEFLIRIGYLENSEEMMKALKQFRGRGDQLQERFDCLVGFGLDFNTVSSMVKLAPTALNQTKEILEKKIDFLINFLGYPVESIVAFPTYLCYDLGRISARFSMYKWLQEKGAAKPMLSVSTLLASSDKRFAKYFVSVHPEGPAVWERFKNHR